jgi:hypothetical protein
MGTEIHILSEKPFFYVSSIVINSNGTVSLEKTDDEKKALTTINPSHAINIMNLLNCIFANPDTRKTNFIIKYKH